MRLFAAILSLVMLQDSVNSVEGRLQKIVTTVRDESGHLVRNLRAEDFVLEEDGIPQKLAHCVEDSDVPVSLGILIDVSGSMIGSSEDGITGVKAAAGTTRVLLRMMKPGDEFILMSFSGGFSVRQNFTEDIAEIEKELPNPRSGGDTNLVGGVMNALKEIKKAKHRKRALIVMTDAVASGDLEALAKSVQEAEVVVYSFAIRSGERGRDGPSSQPILRTLEVESGGRSIAFDMQSKDLIQKMIAFDREIAAELRGQYTLSYYATSPGPAERHAIRVRTTTPGRRVQVYRQLSPAGK